MSGLTARREKFAAGGPWLRRLVLLVNGALIVALAYSAARLTWLLLAPSLVLNAPPPTAATAGDGAVAELALLPTSDAAAANIAVETIAGWHLFGERRAAPAPLAAPPTSLNLRLAGIFYNAAENAQALALIAAGGELEQVYRAGDTIVGDVRIEQIQPDKVILARDGRLETLPLPRETAPDAGAGAAAPAGPANSVAAGAIARRIKTRPDSLQDLAYADPYVRHGRFVGLRLRPGRNRQLLGQLGLRTGDVLTELNSTPLTDPGQSIALLTELLSADNSTGQIQAKVLRDGAELAMTFNLSE